jgi:hypothetical protein
MIDDKSLDTCISERIDVVLDEDASTVMVGFGVLWATMAAAIIGIVVKGIKDKIIAAQLKCGAASTVLNQKCIALYRIRAYQDAISKAKQLSNKCKKTNNPSKCMEKVNTKVKKLNDKINDLKKDVKLFDQTLKGK